MKPIKRLLGTFTSVGFDVVKRCEALGPFYRQVGLEEQAAWTDRRLKKIGQSAGN